MVRKRSTNRRKPRRGAFMHWISDILEIAPDRCKAQTPLLIAESGLVGQIVSGTKHRIQRLERLTFRWREQATGEKESLCLPKHDGGAPGLAAALLFPKHHLYESSYEAVLRETSADAQAKRAGKSEEGPEAKLKFLEVRVSFYASDFLEPLLAASDVRAAVRQHCLALLDSVDPDLRARLRQQALYVGGKCMGYPAVWLLHRILEPKGVDLATVIEQTEPALCVSLTTSIVDDLMDGDEQITADYVAFLYVLIAHAAFGQNITSRLLPEQSALLQQALDVCINPTRVGPNAERRGNRVGHFFRMVAAGPARASLSLAEANAAIEAVGMFGEVCGHVDDWIDLEVDFERGERENVALSLLRDLRKTHTNGRRIDSAEMDIVAARMNDLIVARLRNIQALLSDHCMELATATLDEVIARLQRVRQPFPIDARS
jgi:hypothetical protein